MYIIIKKFFEAMVFYSESFLSLPLLSIQKLKDQNSKL